MANALSVSLIVIGDEILNGRTTDLNGQWLSKFLFKKGMELTSMRFIRDNESEMKEALKHAFNTSDIVITSGGIGPTIDDKTKKVLADYFQKKIIERDDVAKIVTDQYIKFGREWNKNLNHYHLFPEDFIPINNPKGLAPGLGFYDSINSKILLSGPGVPREFQAMNEYEFYPLIQKYFKDRFKENFQVVVRTKGVAEEKIFNELCPSLWNDLEVFGKVSSLPHTIGIDIVISFHGDPEIYSKKLESIKKIFLESEIQTNVWQFGNLQLPQMVLEEAAFHKKTFAFAESCTGGLTSSKITDLPGCSEFFYGSVISYDNSAKNKLLNVSNETLNQFGAVSIECAKEMAEGVRLQMNTDYGISITGIAGPTGGSILKPIGTVVIGVSSKDKLEATIYQFPGDRIRLKERFSDMALLSLLEMLKN